ncbi:MAG: radical SAM protein, partial [Candidatus Diapherotrites archaeon]
MSDNFRDVMPSTFWLVTNYGCNNRCVYCYARESVGNAEKSDKVMDLEYAKDVLQEMKDCGAKHCLLIGGEPTLYPHLLEIIEFGTKIGLSMKIVSNGTRMADKTFVEKLKNAGLVHASISIEASTQELHDQITSAKSFERMIQGIKNVQELGISNNTNLTISSLNMEEIVPTAKMLA